jgi:hypothetical protein
MTTSFLEDELIFYKENDQIKSGGYSVKSALLNNNISPMTTMNSSILGGGEKVSDAFDNLAVPAGLFFINQRVPKVQQKEKWEPHKAIPDDLYDKLFDLITFDNKNSSNKKQKKSKKLLSIIKNKKTRKN